MEILILCVFCVAVGVVLGWSSRATFGYWLDTRDGTDHDDHR
jgi:hypothetical protein